MTPDEVLEQNVSIPLTQWVKFMAERTELIATLEKCVDELASEFTGVGDKDLSGGLVPSVRALLAKVKHS